MNAQLDIFGSQPPQFKGETFDPVRDGKRLEGQLDRVRKLMLKNRGFWFTLEQIGRWTDAPEASVSARLRDLRREGLVIERRYVKKGLWEYCLVKTP